MMDRIRQPNGPDGTGRPFECVEPQLGSELGLLADPELDADLRRRLLDHAEICDACRLELEIERRVAAGLESGDLKLDENKIVRLNPAPRLMAWGGGLAVAASLLLMFLLPPAPAGPNVLRRAGEDSPHFLRPVEGEVVSTAHPELSWTPIEGATAYRLEISRVGGGEIVTARVEEPSLRVPDSFPLDDAGRYRAVIEPVPADLAGLADVNVTFRRDGTGPFLLYRIGASSPFLRLLGAVGLISLGFGLVVSLTRRTPRKAPRPI